MASKSLPVEPQARAVAAEAQPAVVHDHASAKGAPNTRAARDIALADGSDVHVRTASDLLVVRDDAAHIELSLERGSALFDVVPNREREFSVSAGMVRVTVLGTEFTVEREDGQVRVGVTRGKVRVSSAAGVTIVRAGQAKSFESGSAKATAGGRSPRAASRDEAKTSWRALSKDGDYEGAYPMIVAGADVPDDSEALMDAADAARLSHHPQAALGFLRKVVSNHATSAVAPQAAFMSGQLLQRLGEPLEAADAFRTAQELAPAGSLAEDGLAREVEAWSNAGHTAEAQRSARMYEERYPSGRWLRAIQAHVGSPAR